MSIINQDIFKIAKDTSYRENYYNSNRKRISITNKLEGTCTMSQGLCSLVRSSGIEPEILDLRQWMFLTSVFVNHYYRPDINEMITNRIRPVLDSLLKELS
jgi:hypothetical protein